ncbi:hypothetical protein KUTeg_000491 [Tegillarca granosa]|uniref:C2HC/C3H-type domain-containing protein n=1 Tax=Tegillarca granosa TaxID=220873 RepID=A0ABQ9G234_TEGGR|nr:hypothetical protein KUTeg_000491 [Tegillarca granosa]
MSVMFSDYVQCPYCSRRFNEKAAERHINFCKEQSQRLGRKPAPDVNAKAKQAARLQYQPPKPKNRTTPGSTPGGYSPVTSSSSTSRGARSTPSSSNISPANKQGVGRTPPGASNGYSRQQGGPSTRGRSTGPTSQYSSGDYLDPSPNDYQDNLMGLGKALRTGRDPTAYNEARRNVKPSAGSAHLKQTPNSSNSRGGIRGIDTSALSGGNPSYGYPSYREETDYYSSSETDYYSPPGYSNVGYPSKTGYNMGGGSGGGGRFCHECGTKYPVSSAKFCCECGVRRMMIS